MSQTTDESQIRDQIIRYIAEHVAERGFPPTVREIGVAVELASPSTVHQHLKVLERQGRISRVPNSPRAIRVL